MSRETARSLKELWATFSMSDSSLLLGLINDLLDWREGAHEILGDYLEEQGLGRQFHRQGGLHTRVGVVRALLEIGAIEAETVLQLALPKDEQVAALSSASRSR